MNMKRALVLALLVALIGTFVAMLSSFKVNGATQKTNDFSKLPVCVYTWWGGEFKADESASLIGQYYGWELYFPNTTVLAIDFKGEYSDYDVDDSFVSVGARVSYLNYSFGIGLAEQIYGVKPEIVFAKGYVWGAIWYPSLDARLSYDETFCCDYGRVSASVDWRGRPFGTSASYMFNLTPSSSYEEFRFNLSGYLGYPCFLCYENEYDCDLRLYVGPRLASFFASKDNWQDYFAMTAAIKFRSPHFGIGFEYQWVWQEDPWNDGIYRQDKFVISANTSLGGLWLLIQEVF